MHQEAHRPANKIMPLRYSRHYYDLALLAQSEVKAVALSDLKLLTAVVDFKQRFYPSTWAKFELAKPGNFKLVPNEERIKELQKDFHSMQNMIFDKRLSLETIIETLATLEMEINKLKGM